MKKYWKTCLILVVLCAALLALASCGKKTCKVSGCERDVFQDGYCDIHYAEKALTDLFS